jgi:hypothetical protein
VTSVFSKYDVEITMPTQLQDQQHTDPKKPQHPLLHTAIGKHVLHALGQPGDLRAVQVRQLWEDHYRVNVLVGGAASAKVAHSYFLVTDNDGNIIASTPKITRQY